MLHWNFCSKNCIKLSPSMIVFYNQTNTLKMRLFEFFKLYDLAGGKLHPILRKSIWWYTCAACIHRVKWENQNFLHFASTTKQWINQHKRKQSTKRVELIISIQCIFFGAHFFTQAAFTALLSWVAPRFIEFYFIESCKNRTTKKDENLEVIFHRLSKLSKLSMKKQSQNLFSC